MNIALIGFGSRGDVQPFLALALALRERGHSVTLAAPHDFATLVTAYEVDYVPIHHSFKALLEMNVLEQVKREGFRPQAIAATVRRSAAEMKALYHDAMTAASELAPKADMIIAHGLVSALAYTLHQQFHVPILSAVALPSYPTREFPNVFFPSLPIAKRFYNPLTHRLIMRIMIAYMMDAMNGYRRQVGLTTLSLSQTLDIIFSEQIPLAMHYSPRLGSVPSDWGAHIHVVGTWPLPAPANWTPPDKLSAFLAQGDPPIFIGFGSAIVPNPAKMIRCVSEALRIAGLRGVLQAGWAGLTHEDDQLTPIEDVPHDWLFPRMAAIVHHGGSGTTHSAVRAGKPSLVVPFYADQPYWGRRVAELGVGVSPISPKRLSSERLAAAFRTLTQDSNLQRRAAELGALLRQEDGLGAACRLVEQFVQ
jgi:sterol 3beta-glucosyltransferase